MPYGYFERPLLHPVGLAPIRRTHPWWLLLPAALPILAAFVAAYFVQAGELPLARSAAAITAALPATASASVIARGAGVPFEVCYYNDRWSPPDTDLQAQHLQGDPRYRDLVAVRGPLTQERVHVELGPFRSTSAFTDFVQLSGLWTDPNATSAACPADLTGKAELWALQLRIRRFEATGSDLVAYAEPQSAGIEVSQVAIPPGAVALHVLNPDGAKLAPDVSLRG